MPPTAQKKPQRMKGVTPPPFTIPAHLQTRNRPAEAADPLLVRIFSGYLVVRAALFLIAALFLFGPVDNPLSAFLVSHASLFSRRLPVVTEGPNAAAAIQSYLGGYCIFFGLLYSLTAWRWIVRQWIARWALMFLSGATAIKSILAVILPGASLYLLGGIPVGNPIPLSPIQMSLLVVSACMNLAICFYLMFYPGVEKTFERPFQ